MIQPCSGALQTSKTRWPLWCVKPDDLQARFPPLDVCFLHCISTNVQRWCAPSPLYSQVISGFFNVLMNVGEQRGDLSTWWEIRFQILSCILPRSLGFRLLSYCDSSGNVSVVEQSLCTLLTHCLQITGIFLSVSHFQESELQSIQLRAQVEQLREEKERLLNSLLEAELVTATADHGSVNCVVYLMLDPGWWIVMFA